MKKIFLFLTLITLTQDLFAQGVGINTTSPDPSAALDIQSTNKGILIPRVALQSLADKITIVDPANSLMVYNTNNALKYGIGYYYNEGMPSSPSWKKLSDVAMPYYYGIGVENSAIFRIENFNQTSGATAIYGWGYGNATGIYSKSSSGNALVADGKVKIFGNGQNPGQGKVLTTDDFGNATWQGAVAFNLNGVEGNGGEIDVAPNTDVRIPFKTKSYDLQNNYSSNDRSFIAPVDGIYHFDSHVRWTTGGDGSPGPVIVRLVRIRNGNKKILMAIGSVNEFGEIHIFSMETKLLLGDTIHMELSHTKPLISLTTDEDTFFSGHLIVKL